MGNQLGSLCGNMTNSGSTEESGWHSVAGVVNVVEPPTPTPAYQNLATASADRSQALTRVTTPEQPKEPVRLQIPALEDAEPPLRGPLTPTPLRTERFVAGAPVSWTRGELIGAGAFGRVYLGLNNETGHLMAVKQVPLSKDQGVAGRVAEHVRDLELEVNLLKQLDHPNIVRYLGTDRTHEHLNIFLEFVPGGSIASLLSKFGSFQETVVKLYTRQILLGLEYLHNHQIMHRDVKGANILVDNTGLVKLADFGASKQIENLVTIDSGHKSIKGTPYWMAPEVIKQTGHGRQADIWSVGCTVIEMATGKPPWSQFSSQVSALFHIASSKGPPPIPEDLSPECKDFLLLCFNRVPKDRPNATRLLKHPFLADTLPHSLGPPLTAIAGLDQPVTRLLQLPTAVPSPIKEEPDTPFPAQHDTNPPSSPQAALSESAGQPSPVSTPRPFTSPASSDSLPCVALPPGSQSSCSFDPANLSAESDYNPVEEPSWLQCDSLEMTRGSLPDGHRPDDLRDVGAACASPRSFAMAPDVMPQEPMSHTQSLLKITPSKPVPFQEHSINITAAAQAQANILYPSCAKVLSPHGDLHANKQLVWQAELEKELAEQRTEARHHLARDCWP